MQSGDFDGRNAYVIDLEYWFRLLQYGRAYVMTDALSGFRVSSNSWSVAIGRNQCRDFMRLARTVAGESAFGISELDLVSARAMAKINQLLRQLFYRYAL